MTAQQIATFIIRRWMDDHAPQAIMMQLICLGHPMKKKDILYVIKRFVSECTENNTLKRKV